MAKLYHYADAATSRTGHMYCTIGKHSIATGQYRYYSKRGTHHTQCRACTVHDPALGLC